MLYNSLLAGISGITLPSEEKWAASVYWLYNIFVNNDFGMNRDELMKRLRGKGIDTRPFFYPIHLMPSYKTDEVFPVAEDIARRGISLPSAATLTDDQINFIVNVIKELRH